MYIFFTRDLFNVVNCNSAREKIYFNFKLQYLKLINAKLLATRLRNDKFATRYFINVRIQPCKI